MISQYTDYGSISADIQNLVANNVSLLDSYILMQTGQYEYKALIRNNASRDVEMITITRTNENYNAKYNVTRSNGQKFDYDVTNEYYIYSNVGVGKSLDIPAYDGAMTFGITSLTVLIFFMVVFKGALFKWLRN